MTGFAWTLAAVLGAGAGPAPGADRAPAVPLTRPPVVYVIDYSDSFFTDPAYLDQFRQSPPDLLHVGKAVPITHLWGPIKLLKGENQYTGGPGHTLSWENIELLAPEALAERIETIRSTLRRYHEAGIPQIAPYISYHTLAGDHEKRLGFWKFYDRWDQYAKWAGPRPKRDPFDWLVVDRQGKFVGGSCGGYSPDYFAPLHRYRACINHPDWAEWHRRLVRSIAEAGYDGCFVDNTHPDDCFCRYCKEWFRGFLKDHAGLDWVKRLTSGLDAAALQLDSPDAPPELVRRARLLRTSGHLAELRRVGREVKPGFAIFPNGNSIQECLTTGAQCDYNMFESTYSPGIMAVGQVCRTHVGTLLYAQHMHARSIFLGYEAGRKGWENVAELGLAEMAAFSGGGGFAARGPVQAKYRTFFRQHPDLFDGWQAFGPDAVLMAHWGTNPLSYLRPLGKPTVHEHLAGSQRALVPLVDATLPEDAAALAGFQAVYLEALHYELSERQWNALEEYARRGGWLVLGHEQVAISGRPAREMLGLSREAPERALGGGRAVLWDGAKPALRSEPICDGQGRRANLRFGLYRKGDRLALHAVNYNVCLLDPKKQVLEVDETPLRIPLPAGWTSARAACYSPDAPGPRALDCEVVEGKARVLLPRARTYQIVALERE